MSKQLEDLLIRPAVLESELGSLIHFIPSLWWSIKSSGWKEGSEESITIKPPGFSGPPTTRSTQSGRGLFTLFLLLALTPATKRLVVLNYLYSAGNSKTTDQTESTDHDIKRLMANNADKE
jgi:hypothetical protein